MLSDWLSEQPADVEEWMTRGMRLGCEYFKMKIGIISQIDTDKDAYQIRAVSSTMGDVFTPGMSFELSNTYCSAVVEKEDVVTYQQVGKNPEMILHPVYVALQLESYIGVPLMKDGKVLGTLNFSSYAVHPESFGNNEIDLIKRMGEKVQAMIY